MSKLVTRVVEGVEFAYQPSSGRLFRKFKSGWKETGLAKDSDGYLQVALNNKCLGVHRLAWYITYGVWPTSLVDHINGIKNDNKLVNLREATKVTNGLNRPSLAINNTSSYTGVSKVNGSWRARIQVNGKEIRKCFKTKEEAIKARKQLEIEYGIA